MISKKQWKFVWFALHPSSFKNHQEVIQIEQVSIEKVFMKSLQMKLILLTFYLNEKLEELKNLNKNDFELKTNKILTHLYG